MRTLLKCWNKSNIVRFDNFLERVALFCWLSCAASSSKDSALMVTVLAASMSSWLMAAEKGKAMEGSENLCLDYRRGQRHGGHHTLKVCPFIFLSSRRLCPCFSCTVWRPHCVRSFRLHAVHRGVEEKFLSLDPFSSATVRRVIHYLTSGKMKGRRK